MPIPRYEIVFLKIDFIFMQIINLAIILMTCDLIYVINQSIRSVILPVLKTEKQQKMLILKRVGGSAGTKLMLST